MSSSSLSFSDREFLQAAQKYNARLPASSSRETCQKTILAARLLQYFLSPNETKLLAIALLDISAIEKGLLDCLYGAARLHNERIEGGGGETKTENDLFHQSYKIFRIPRDLQSQMLCIRGLLLIYTALSRSRMVLPPMEQEYFGLLGFPMSKAGLEEAVLLEARKTGYPFCPDPDLSSSQEAPKVQFDLDITDIDEDF